MMTQGPREVGWANSDGFSAGHFLLCAQLNCTTPLPEQYCYCNSNGYCYCYTSYLQAASCVLLNVCLPDAQHTHWRHCVVYCQFTGMVFGWQKVEHKGQTRRYRWQPRAPHTHTHTRSVSASCSTQSHNNNHPCRDLECMIHVRYDSSNTHTIRTCRFPAVCSSICVCQLLSTLRGHTISVPLGPAAAGGEGAGSAAAVAVAAAAAAAAFCCTFLAAAWRLLPAAAAAALVAPCIMGRGREGVWQNVQ